MFNELSAVEHRTRFEQSALPQTTCDMQGRLVNVNDAFCRLVERPREELIGLLVPELNHPSDLGEADDSLRKLLGQEVTSARVERVLNGPDNRPVPVLIDADLLRSSSGAPIGAAAFLHDLRQLRDVEQRRQQQEEFFLALAQRATDLAIVADAEGRMLYVSPAVSTMLGYRDVDVLSHTGWEFIHPDDIEPVREQFEAVVREGGTRIIHLRARAANGAWRHLEETVSNMLGTAVGGLVCNLRDITEQVEAQVALTASEARYRAIVENADEGIWVASRQGETTFANARLLDILGLSAEEVYARPAPELLEPASAELAWRGLASRHERGPERYEIDYRHPDGSLRHLAISATPLRDDTGFEGSMALVSDITTSRLATRRLRHEAEHDALTGLPNRAHLQRVVVQALERSPESTAVLFIDLDHFKVVNDARGHGAGDQLLQEVATRLRSTVRPKDFVGRFGGDEFVIVCQNVTASNAYDVAERVIGVLDGATPAFEEPLQVAASIGIAMSPAESGEELLRNADAAMYAAKSAGRGSIRFFDSGLAATAEVRYRLTNELRSAIDRADIDLAYQPVIHLDSGLVVGAEGLSRWLHPDLGSVPPDQFVAVALETGLAPRLDFASIRTAARDLAAFRAAGAIAESAYVAINLSPRSLDHPALVEELQRAVAGNGLSAKDLVLEVTEATVVSHAGEAVETLGRLADLGHVVAIDDFGTGHSALSYLRDLPAGILKIDRTFVVELAVSADARTIMRSIVGMAEGLGMQVVAEGVEDARQAEALHDLGCAYGQGWLWAPAGQRQEVLDSRSLNRMYQRHLSG